MPLLLFNLDKILRLVRSATNFLRRLLNVELGAFRRCRLSNYFVHDVRLLLEHIRAAGHRPVGFSGARTSLLKAVSF